MNNNIYRIQASYEFFTKENCIEICSNINKASFTVECDSPERMIRILKELSLGLTIEDYSELCLDNDISYSDGNKIFNSLRDSGVIVTNDLDLEKYIKPIDYPYDRQIRFFNSYETDSITGEMLQDTLSKTRVLIVGLGSYGSWLSLLCTKMGFYEVIGVDFDTVEISNLDRQVLYSPRDIGRFKTEAASDFLNQLCLPGTSFIGVNKEIRTIEDLDPLLDRVDFVFNAFGYYPWPKASTLLPGLLAKACIESNTPFISLSSNVVGPIYAPEVDTSHCYLCACKHFRNHVGIDPQNKSPYIQQRMFAPIIASICSSAIWESVAYLTKMMPSNLHDKLLVQKWSFYNDTRSEYIPMDCNNRCGKC